MTYISARQPGARSLRPAPATHLFGVGQVVRLRGNFGTFPKTSEVYHITGTLPPRGDSPQYRIRNGGERHERVATQDSLEPVRPSQSNEGTTLIERTFGHGQGTETQQSRDQEAEAGKGTAQA
ncbi:hypothetical protein [Mesorhizobium sp.]|uniref:hypothetical protein n=1 Tax=Mesorhizobium sp. TaxID=1871066 RepID=UPI000FE3B1FF|nr:hypothetical protein [Mesorhizobium sp.]RWA74027.1 MAG: hypothetical protein EOQ28_13570 [Mesorhizobium sp.]RWC05170.1 MAG: hypothetical protein EOQ57_02010 [Mesorhizobium sp.]RWH73436.1 MAG: hypothetical protein EOQ84_07435 [Mesorhizobium sp.]RWK09660.1 MAG: hypothetical protein EOR42_02885 [Mesorhizobium sp.]RWK13256.1 MAG: hypothetical protein EOR39_01445 [Mesorhizobium sp.]